MMKKIYAFKNQRVQIKFAVITASQAVSKVYVCYSNFGHIAAKTYAEEICKALNSNGVPAAAVSQNIFMLIAPIVPSLRICGTLDNEHFAAFKKINFAALCRQICATQSSYPNK